MYETFILCGVLFMAPITEHRTYFTPGSVIASDYQAQTDSPVMANDAANGRPPKPDRLAFESQSSYRDVRKIGKGIYGFIEDTYFGTDGYRTCEYLIPEPREAFYETRRAFSYYNNVFKPVINAMVDDVFADEIDRSCDNDLLTNSLMIVTIADHLYNRLSKIPCTSGACTISYSW